MDARRRRTGQRQLLVALVTGLFMLLPVAPVLAQSDHDGDGQGGADGVTLLAHGDDDDEDREKDRSGKDRSGKDSGEKDSGGDEMDEPGGGEGESDEHAESGESRDLVIDALAHLANDRPGHFEAIAEKIEDALEAPDKSGVDLTKVAEAEEALEAGDMVAVRALLQSSIAPITEPVVGDETGTTAMLDSLSGRTEWGGAAAALAALSAAAIVAGLLLAYRWRPRKSLEDLRESLTEGEPR
ncbi:MAG: hypothetical protein U0990_07955 [Candidatus Nanopelagicales bacterium]|nr:hypothetical protein [Candidatus Nanopelagicales bacterium]MDZ4250008.1 hypothetical protein [Candidatus Nanopelagicales bacterium]MDZ7578967.1 hypothetical protein [Candidatus Nanopelagicales bacterium]